MQTNATDITALLIRYATTPPPEAARAIMRLSLLDWAACGMAGAAQGDFSQWAAMLAAPGPCTGFDGRQRAVSEAALVNGTLSHALDYDDTHFDHIGHPSVVVCSAALAVGTACDAALDAITDAALAGAEASIATGLWLGRAHYQIGYHQTATAGAFGATIAAARLLGLTSPQIRHALGLCATMASGLKSQFGTMGKPLNAGLAARTGVEAAQWAQAGMTAAPDGLAGDLGFGDTHHGGAHPVTFEWRMPRVSHKFHACCHGLHACLEAVRDAPLAQARQIIVHTHPRWLTVCNQPAPDTGLGAKFSYAHVLAMTAHGHDTRDIAAFTDACARDADLVAFRSRVSVRGDDGLTEMQARVDVDGQVFEHDLDAALPLDLRTHRIQQKARALVGARADHIWTAITKGDRAGLDQLLMS